MFLLLAFFLPFILVYLIIHPFILSKFSKILKIGDFTFKSIVNINFSLVVIQLSVFLIFTLVNFNKIKGNSKKIFLKLAKSGILVRKMDVYKMKNSLRITIGNNLENKKFINTLRKII